MSDIVIKVENLSKQYRLGKVGTGTLTQDINSWWSRIRGKEDPTLKIGEKNDRTSNGESEYVWSLKDINFEVKQGDTLGIIGKNGAGKSTLLKILSKVTAPTTGKIKVKGRIASLLEVGTGFHPELSGRENIFLNGAILGMSKNEIKKKFDEIVDFSGVERYIDTPVKRYSSGMYVRLAFAVAAHLESEILIVDEVLAVGDAEFQKKCLGKMSDVSSKDGRTVLFVSHNMATINKLCKNSILLEQGTILKQGITKDVIPYYLSPTQSENMITHVKYDIDNSKPFQITEIKLTNQDGNIFNNGIITDVDDFYVDISYLFNQKIHKCHLTLIARNSMAETVFFIDRTDFHKDFFNADIGSYKTRIKIQNPLLKEGEYYLSFGLSDNQTGVNAHKFDVIKFKIEFLKSTRNTRDGFLYLPKEWQMLKL